METFLAGLRRAREDKGITLAEVSSATFISENMLAAIEQGNFAVLPQAYIRAFIREYALVVDLDPDETLRKYDEARKSNEPSPAAEQGAVARTPIVELPSPAQPDTNKREVLSPSRLWKFIAIVVGIIIVELLVWQYIKKQPSSTVEEIPFQSVVKENEDRLVPDSLRRLRAATLPGVPLPHIGADSLTLRGVATDSVWVHIVLDSLETREYLFTRGGELTVKARKKFIVTLGNAGGIQFTLNNRKIGALGKRLAVVRNVVVDAQTQPGDRLRGR